MLYHFGTPSITLGRIVVHVWGFMLRITACAALSCSLISVGFFTEANASSRMCRNLALELASVGKSSGNPTKYKNFAAAAKRQTLELRKTKRRFNNGNCKSTRSSMCRQLRNAIPKMERNLSHLIKVRDASKPKRKSRNRSTIRSEMLRHNCNSLRVTKRNAPKKKIVQNVKLAAKPTPFLKNDLPVPSGSRARGHFAANLSSGYRAVCVRTCDGYFFPISFLNNPAGQKDQFACQAMCPQAEVQVYSHRLPEQEIEDMVDRYGNKYTDLTTAFEYIKPRAINAKKSCSCGKPLTPQNMTMIKNKELLKAANSKEPVLKFRPSNRPDLYADPETLDNTLGKLSGTHIQHILHTPRVGELVEPTQEERNVRVVGTKFLPDPKEVINLQAQVQMNDQTELF